MNNPITNSPRHNILRSLNKTNSNNEPPNPTILPIGINILATNYTNKQCS